MSTDNFGALGADFFIKTFDLGASMSQADLDALVQYVQLTTTIMAIGEFTPNVQQSVWMILERVDVPSAPGYTVTNNTEVTMTSGGLVSIDSMPWTKITGKPAFFSGAYADLTGKPTIPTSFSSLVNSENTFSLDGSGVLTFPNGTTSEGNSITIPVDESLTVNVSTGMPLELNSTFKINPESIKLPTGNGIIYAGEETAAGKWSLDSGNKTLYFPDAGDGVLPRISYSTYNNIGMELKTYAKGVRISTQDGFNESNWTFGATGDLTLPAGGDIVDSTGTSVLGGGGSTLPANASGYLTNDGSGNLAWAAGDGTFSGAYADLTGTPSIVETNQTLNTGDSVSFNRLTVTGASGIEGGEIQLAKAPTSTLAGDVIIDVYENKLRFFEGGGNGRGFYLDLTTGANNTNTNIMSGGSGGAQGEPGAAGADGAPGQGVPTGGTVGQVLAKIDSTDYNTEWVDQTSGGPTNEITNTDGNNIWSVSVGTDGVVTMNTVRGGIEFGAMPEVGGPNHLHIMRPAGAEGSTDLFFGDDYNYVKMPALYGAGTQGVEIGSSYNSGAVSVWKFGTDGTTTFPTLTVPISDNATPSGTGQTIKFSDSTQQAIIYGPESTAGATSAERVIIQGAPGYTGTAGEGGDVYVWAGPGGSNNGQGGDIKVRAGRGNGTGTGGYLNFQAGDSNDGAGGYINIESGESGTSGSGGDITVHANSGGEITLRTESSTGTNNWLFDADGDLVLPAGKTIRDTSGVDLFADPSTGDPAYKGFKAHYGRMWGNSADPNGPINKIVIYKDTATPSSTIDTSANNDTFTVTGLTGSDVVVMLVAVGEDVNQTTTAELKTFAESIIDNVILTGGVEGDINTAAEMKTAFYNNFATFSATLTDLKTGFEFFSVNNQFNIDPAFATGKGATFNGIRYNMSNDTLGEGSWGQGTGTHQVGDVFVIPGNTIQDANSNFLSTPANDVTVTITDAPGGSIGSFTVTGTLPRPAETWPTNSIGDGGDDEYDTGNLIATNLTSNISYNSGNVDNGSEAFGGGDYVVTYKDSIFGVFVVDPVISSIGTTGGSGMDGAGQADTGSLYGAANSGVSIGDFVFTNSTMTSPDDDLYIKAVDDLWLDALDDDVHIRANDDVRIKAGFDFQAGSAQAEWRFGNEGIIYFPNDSEQSTAYTGDYDDLTNKPTLFSGDYDDLTNKPTLFSGAYADLTGAPTIPADVSDLTDTTNLLIASVSSLVNGSKTVSLGTDGVLTLPEGSAINDAIEVVAVTLDQFNDGGFTGTQVFTRVSNILYQVLPSGPTMELVSGIWRLKIGVAAYYYSTDLITWSTIAGGLPAPVGTLTTVVGMKLTVDGYDWMFDDDGGLILPAGGNILVDDGKIISADGEDFKIIVQDSDDNGNRLDLVVTDGTDQATRVEVDIDGMQINTNLLDVANQRNWRFKTDGSTEFPDDTISQYNSLKIKSGASSSTAIWTFGTDGDLVLPAGGVISEGGGLTGAIQLTPAGGANAYQALVIYPTAAADGDHLHLTAGGGATELYLGDDSRYVKLVNGGNIEVRATTTTSSAAWTFDTAGNIDAQQALGIKVPDGVPSSVTDITMITGYWELNPLSNLATTGGSGSGLTVNVTETDGYASAIAIATAGTGYTAGDVITVTSGTSSAEFIIAVAGRNTWQFGTDGKLQLPSGGDIVDSTGTTVLGGGSTLPADASGYLVNNGTGALSWAAGDGTFSGDYDDLTNKPTLFDGNYNSLTNKPTYKETVSTGTGPGGNNQADSLVLAGLNPTENIPSTYGGDLILKGGYGGANNDLLGEVRIKSGTIGSNFEWHFTVDKKIKLPSGGDIVDSTGASVFVSLSTLKQVVAASTDFADFQSRIANM